MGNRFLHFTFFIFAISFQGLAQTDDTIYEVAQTQTAPAYAGDELQFLSDVRSRFEAKHKNAPEIMDMAFVVEKDGSVSNVVANSFDKPFSAAQNKLLASISPKWKPAKSNGKTVRCSTFVSVPIVKELVSPDGFVSDQPHIDDNAYFWKELEQSPEFTGGIATFEKYILDNADIPDKSNFKGNMRVMFIVEKDGSTSDVKTSGNLGISMSQEIIKVIANSPKWTPGKRNGKNVRSHFICLLFFSEGNVRTEIQKS
ncbi:MAG: hypothetical protein EOO50_07260 [Flavobacterium sp.]|uniref:energy transducer TonB n=1 Tax=Flavobacterium sp. TaxID=239 RepID=UPI0012185584|nr:energy transducer TonB [Flavobacterium sp.]RZJ67054.1 MAG: hypothetical protein EOO50_07260 [Flavobacterium sp.]